MSFGGMFDGGHRSYCTTTLKVNFHCILIAVLSIVYDLGSLKGAYSWSLSKSLGVSS